jgi:hypothetical protein
MTPSRRRPARAQIRARYRKPSRTRSSRWFYSTLAVVVAAGVALVVVSLHSSSSSAVPPQPSDPATGAPGDHWHTAFGVNICGQWLPNPPTFETTADNPNVRAGIHTHGDGYIHIHPFFSYEGGTHASFGRFFTYGGWSVSDTSLSVWSGPGADPTKKDWSNGERCPPGTPDAGQAGFVRWAVNCATKTGDPASYRLKDQQVFALTFIPKNQPIPVTPNAAIAPAADGGNTAGAVATSKCKPSAVNNPGVPQSGASSSTPSSPPSS